MPANRNKNIKIDTKTQKPDTRRIGFDFPVKLLNDFKVAVSMKGAPSMTAVLIELMESYSEKVKKERKINKLSD